MVLAEHSCSVQQTAEAEPSVRDEEEEEEPHAEHEEYIFLQVAQNVSGTMDTSLLRMILDAAA